MISAPNFDRHEYGTWLLVNRPLIYPLWRGSLIGFSMYVSDNNIIIIISVSFHRNVGGNIRDGITGLGGSVMSKPREFAHLIKNKFGSADNINQLSASKCVLGSSQYALVLTCSV